jgi:hypothetical protein
VHPQNKEELFNLRHAQARNVVEQIFGVMKQRWEILIRPPEFIEDDRVQYVVPAALAAVHNFIQKHDPSDLQDQDNTLVNHAISTCSGVDSNPGTIPECGILSESLLPNHAEKRLTIQIRDQIAAAMWNDYQTLLHERQIDGYE